MSSIVSELQQELFQTDCDIVNALRKAHLLAIKLKLTEFDIWIQNELNGYDCSSSEIPEYRNVQGVVKLHHPVHGWIPVMIEDKAEEDILSHRKLFQSISEIVGFSKSEKSLYIPFPGNVSQKISQMADAPIVFEAALFITRESLKGVSEKVKTALLEWTITLEGKETKDEIMTKMEQNKKIQEFLARGEEIGRKEYNTSGLIPTISGPLYEAWMNEIKIFNDRYLKDHPLHSSINSTIFHHKGQLSSHKNMMGHLYAIAEDLEYWQVEQSNPIPFSSRILLGEKKEKNTMTPIIFISHRTEDAEVADMLRDYLVAASIPNEYIFCSSLPGNDVKGVISREVKEKIANSTVNIAILSRGYYESAYCINEAGIIWLQDPQTPAIIIGLPEISHTNMQGFLNGDYKLRRLDDATDISEIYDTVRDTVGTVPVSFSVATAASQKLLTRYAKYLKTRVEPTVPAARPTTSAAPIEDVTTDDERVVLYYILTRKVRCVRKSNIQTWMTESEIYNINVDNALDLLATLGAGTYEKEVLTMDADVFRKYTANAEDLVKTLAPIVEQYQDLSSKRFVEMWDAGAFTDEDKLFIAYIIQNRTSTFGARWLEDAQVKSIQQWEINNCLDGSVASTYSALLNQFVENRFVYESGWTDHGNAREYTLCPSLKNLLLSTDFSYINELETILEAHTEKLPF